MHRRKKKKKMTVEENILFGIHVILASEARTRAATEAEEIKGVN